MSSRKEQEKQLTREERIQVDHLLTQYQAFAEKIQPETDKKQAEEALSLFNEQSDTIQMAFVKALARENNQQAANVLAVINATTPEKEVRKEARRGLIRLEGARIYPEWKAPITPGGVVQLATDNLPRFWKGFASQTREEGEMQIFLCWEQGYEYGEARVISYLLDFWNDGVKDVFVEANTKRKVEDKISELRGKMVSSHASLIPCTLAEGKRLLEEALSVNTWRQTTPAEEYRNQKPIFQRLILQAGEIGEDHGTTFISPELEPQEVIVNFIGAWSFGDFGLAYDLLSADSPIKNNMDRDEWMALHRSWYDEAKPARMELGFIHERPQAQTQQNALWLPNSVSKTRPVTKVLDAGWSLEQNETLLSGTLNEMPMGTAVNKQTDRFWFWTSYTLTHEQNVWRIQNSKDEGAQLQGIPSDTLSTMLNEHETRIDAMLAEELQKQDFQAFIEETSWRLTQMLHIDDALIHREPLDYTINLNAYTHSVLTGSPERIIVYLERLAEKFQDERAEHLRRLGSTMVELAFRSGQNELMERQRDLLELAEQILRQAIQVENSAIGHLLLGELLMSQERNEEAHNEMEIAQALQQTDDDPNLLASVENGLGNLMLRAENTEEAITHFSRVAEIDGDYPSIWFRLGFAQRLAGQIEAAAESQRKAIAQDPEDPRPYTELTAIFLNQNEPQKARKILEQGLIAQPESVHLHAMLSSLLFQQGDRRGALHHRDIAERIDPDSEIVQSLRQQMSSTKKR